MPKTENMRPLILITNDDGLYAKGINSLMEELRTMGDVVVVAPDGPRSGMSSAITSLVPIRIRQEMDVPGLSVYSCTGTPVDCVKLAMNEMLDRKPDLLVSGINHGSNAAISVLYSGTMGAALEGTIVGVNSFGISLTNHSLDADFTQAGRYARSIAGRILLEGLPQGVCLNVNVPDIVKPKGIKICTQTKGRWVNEFRREQDEEGNYLYRLTGNFRNDDPDNTLTDEWALANGYVSIVPSEIDMTGYHTISSIKHWEE